jgi:hypothetical protein
MNKENIIFCFYFDEYDDTVRESGLYINATKYLIPKLKYFNKIYKDFPTTRYYMIDQDCYIVMNNFKNKYNKLNQSNCYDLIYVTYNELENFFNDNNIMYKLMIPDITIYDMIDIPLDQIEFNLLMDEFREMETL